MVRPLLFWVAMLKTAVLSIALLGSGCFTAAGAITGGAVASSKIKHGEDVSYSAAVVGGALAGLVVDAALIFAVGNSINNDLDSWSNSSDWTWDCSNGQCND
jgi:hypothetical protein